jgi:hypothetical protein
MGGQVCGVGSMSGVSRNTGEMAERGRKGNRGLEESQK